MVSYAFPDQDLMGEPSLDELFAEPIVRAVMRRDGVEEHDMRGAIERLRDAYRGLLEPQ
jgi:hypothetical protein